MMNFTGFGSSKQSFLLDTKGLCFMCLRENQQDGDYSANQYDEDSKTESIFSQSRSTKLFSFQTLSRYLGLSFRQVFNVSVPLRSTGMLEQSDILVSLCDNCSEVTEKFTSFHQNLEMIEMQLTACIKVIREKVVDGEGNCWRLTTNDQAEALQSEIVMNLRRETIEKCLSHVKRALPRVNVKKLEDKEISPSSTTGSMFSENPNEYVYSSDEECTDDPEDGCDSISIQNSECQEEEIEEVETSKSQNKVAGPNGKKLSYCQQCNKYVRSLIQHTRSTHKTVPHKCQHCEQAFGHGRSLRMHAIIYHYEQNFIALKDPILSDDMFKAAVDIQLLGGQKIHKLPEAEVSRGHKKYKYDCCYCTERYAFKTTLRVHLVRIHYNILRQKLLQLQKNPDLEALKKHANRYKSGNRNDGRVSLLPSTDIRDIGIPSQCIPTLFNYTPKLRTTPAERQQRDTTKCLTCGITFAMKSAYIKHTRLECEENKYITPQSAPEPDLPQSKSFWRHTRLNMAHRCYICRKHFHSPRMLERHIAIQHPPNCADPIAGTDFECEHCIKKFRFFFSYRIHLLTAHRIEVFSSYAPAGTKNKEITNAISTILKEFTKLPNNSNKCNYCKKDFIKTSEIENHIICTHFDEAAVHFQTFFEDKEQRAQDIPPENSCTSSTSFSEGTSMESTMNVDVMKEESAENSNMDQQLVKQEDEEEAINYRSIENMEVAVDPLFILP